MRTASLSLWLLGLTSIAVAQPPTGPDGLDAPEPSVSTAGTPTAPPPPRTQAMNLGSSGYLQLGLGAGVAVPARGEVGVPFAARLAAGWQAAPYLRVGGALEASPTVGFVAQAGSPILRSCAEVAFTLQTSGRQRFELGPLGCLSAAEVGIATDITPTLRVERAGWLTGYSVGAALGYLHSLGGYALGVRVSAEAWRVDGCWSGCQVREGRWSALASAAAILEVQ